MAAKRKTPSPTWKGGPTTRKPRGKRVPEIVIPDTKEDLLAKIGLVLDRVDTLMAQRTDNHIQFSRWDPTMKKPKLEMEDLVARLDALCGDDGPDSNDLINEAFGTPPGTAPSWARPGTFLLWIGYIPCRCIWYGFADPGERVVAADPAEPWFVPSGIVRLGSYSIPLEITSVEHLFRVFLTLKTKERITKEPRSRAYNAPPPKDLGPAFNLFPLADVAKEAARKDLADQPWLAAALIRGPVDAIPLPPHLAFVQMKWTG